MGGLVSVSVFRPKICFVSPLLREKMKRVTLPKILAFVADALRGKGGKFMVGAGITYADICFGSALHGIRKRFGCQVQRERDC